MLLERLVLENYGVYADRSELDLVTTDKKPIIIVGGLNGAGKTTLFEAIMVALYGRTYLGTRTTKAQYMEFVSDRIHRHKNGRRAKRASVEVSFRFHCNGSEDSYVVNRHWDVEGASVTETLQIHKNDQPMDDINGSLWQSFIDGLIPIGIARLFFFDGEKIVRITKQDGDDNEELKSSLDVLFGTDLINRLDADLDLYSLRNTSSKSGDDSVRTKYKEKMEEKNRLTQDMDELEAEIGQKNAELDEMTGRISSKEAKIAGIGGGYADMREDLLTQRATLGEKLRGQSRSIQDDLAGDAPLYLARGILKNIKRQIQSDTEIIQQKYSTLYLKDSIKDLQKDIMSKEFWLDDPVNSAVCKKISKRLNDLIKQPRKNAFFDMSLKTAEWIQETVDEIPSGSQALRAKIVECAKTSEQLAKTESDLNKVPRDDEIGPKISEINEMHQEIGMLKAEIEDMTQRVSIKRAHRVQIQSELKGIVAALQKGRTSNASLVLATRMKKALATYHSNIREKKIQELQANLLDTIRILLHKDMVSRIEVDRDTFEIRVYGDGYRDPIPGGLLSMGERQMVGTALLWAVARTCGRSLPFVIDTPLGRLDGEHLTNLVDRFYPFVSHQIIMLSTDREIGQKEYAKLSRYISRSYHISYDSKKASTSIRGGYFEGEKQTA